MCKFPMSNRSFNPKIDTLIAKTYLGVFQKAVGLTGGAGGAVDKHIEELLGEWEISFR